jgi:hypothetical protein
MVAFPAAGLPAETRPAIPKEVLAFKTRRDLCDHFRGEEAYDEDRRRFLEANLKRYCMGTDQELGQLKKKYQKNKAVMKVLTEYEENIEGR